MGVLIVLRIFENQPHTPPPNFSIFPNGLLGYFIMVLFSLHLCSIINPPFHPQSVFPSTNCPPFIYLIQKPTHGAPTLHQFSKKIAPYPGQPYYIGAPVSVFVHSTQIIHYLFVKKSFISSIPIPFCPHLWRSSSLFGKMKPMSPLVGKTLIIYPCWHRPYTPSIP